jgi:transcription antitermination factor NusA-like protein
MKEEKKELTELEKKAKAAGAVKIIYVERADGTEASLVLKKPHRDILGLYYGMRGQNPIKACDMLYKASRIDDLSDKDIFDNDELFLSAYVHLDNYIDVIELKKNRSTTL